MKMSRGIIWLPERYTSVSPSIKITDFKDIDHNMYAMPNRLIVQLYEILKFEIEERRGHNFEAYVEKLMKEDTKE